MQNYFSIKFQFSNIAEERFQFFSKKKKMQYGTFERKSPRDFLNCYPTSV